MDDRQQVSSKEEEEEVEDVEDMLTKERKVFTCGFFKPMRKRRSMRIADVVFIVGKNKFKQRFLAHRMLMSMNSPFFLELFFGNQPQKDKEISFPDVSPIGFKAMLNYFYDKNFNIQSIQEAVETFVVAKKFQVCHLEELCEAYVLEDTPLTAESACVLYDLASTAEMSNLAYDCTKMIDRDTVAILHSQSFKNASPRVVMDIVRRPLLSVNSEAELVSALIQWAKAECKRRGTADNKEDVEKILCPFLSYVRFSDISPVQVKFLDLSISDEVLTVTNDEDSVTDDNGEPLYSTLESFRTPALKPRMFSEYYKYKLRLVEPTHSKPLLDNQSFVLEININKGGAYVCGVSFGVKPVRPERITSFRVKMQAENTSTGHLRKTSGHFFNTSLLAVLVFDRPLYVKEGQSVNLVTTVMSPKNLSTSYHPGCNETVELDDLKFSVSPRTKRAHQRICIFKEVMIYF